jgi:hypothetical protein
MSTSEVLDDLLKLLDVVQKHADLDGCQHCDKILKSVFESSRN